MMTLKKALRRLSVLALVAACQPPAPPAPVTHPTAASLAPVTHPAAVPTTAGSAFAAAPEWSDDLTITAVAVPATLVVDGNLEEWTHHKKSNRMVYVAVAADRLVLAASLHSTKPLSLTLSSVIPQVARVGWETVGGDTRPLTEEGCKRGQRFMEGWHGVGEQRPAVVNACLELLARHSAFETEYNERFVRRFRLTPQGITTIDGKAIDGATHAATDRSVEVELPVSAMPQLAQAPLIALYAVAADDDVPPDLPLPIRQWKGNPDTRWSALTLATPVSFEPWSAVRTALFKDFEGLGLADRSNYWTPEATLSYHPSKPRLVELVETPPANKPLVFDHQAYDVSRTVAVETSRTLYQPLDKIGNIEIGLVNASRIVTLKAGNVIALGPEMRDGELRGIIRGHIRRRGEVHVFASQSGRHRHSPDGLFHGPTWHVFGIKKDGMVIRLTDEFGGTTVLFTHPFWDGEPKPFFDAKFQRFGFRGLRMKRHTTVTWSWDDRKKKYIRTVRPKAVACECSARHHAASCAKGSP